MIVHAESMAAGWNAAEKRALIGILGAADVQRQLDGVVRNKTIYERIARDLQALGYSHTWEQCRTKVKNLVKRYRKVSALSCCVITPRISEKYTYTVCT